MLINKRHFLQGVALAILGGALDGLPSFAGTSWKTQFHQALRKNPWLLGYESARQAEFPAVTLDIEGTLPMRLRGALYRNGPARHEVGDQRYHHWFDGDGMVHAFHFDGRSIVHRGRYVETAKFASEQGGVMLEQGFGTVLPGMHLPSSADAINTANINIIAHDGELLALWEGGSAYRIDPESLETLGLKNWSDQTKGLPFGAHPRRDHTGTLWNFGYSPGGGGLVLYRIEANGGLKNVGLVPLAQVPMVHDFMLSEHYLLFVLTPFTYDTESQGSFLDHFTWKPEQSGQLLVVEKENLKPVAQFAIPAFWVFHFANAYEDSAGLIHFAAPIYDDPTIMTKAFRDVMRGVVREDFSKSRYVFGTIDLARQRFDLEESGGMSGVEFPVIDPRRQGQKADVAFVMQNQRHSTPTDLNTVVRITQEKMQRFVYADDVLAEEHVFVPDPASEVEGRGWLVGTVLDFHRQRSSINVFDAEHVDDGPLARGHLNYPIPLGLHGNFVAG